MKEGFVQHYNLILSHLISPTKNAMRFPSLETSYNKNLDLEPYPTEDQPSCELSSSSLLFHQIQDLERNELEIMLILDKIWISC